jgi:hypothetical protein
MEVVFAKMVFPLYNYLEKIRNEKAIKYRKRKGKENKNKGIRK